MQVTTSIEFSDFEGWSGGADTLEIIKDKRLSKELESYLEESYGDTIDATTLNDLLWFDKNEIYEALGINEDEDDEYLEESIKRKKLFNSMLRKIK